MLKLFSAAALVAIATASFAQTTTQPEQTTVIPSQTPSMTPSQTPAITPSQTPVIPQQTPNDAPIVGGPAPTTGVIESRPLGGLSKCDNMIGMERETCLQSERAGTGGTVR